MSAHIFTHQIKIIYYTPIIEKESFWVKLTQQLKQLQKGIINSLSQVKS